MPNPDQPAFSPHVSKAQRFYCDLGGEPDGELDVVSGGWERCRADYQVQRDTFPFHCIEYVAQGEGSMVLRGRTYRLTPGTVFSYGPDVPHHLRTDAASLLTKYFVDFGGRRSVRLLDEAGLGQGGAVQVSEPNRIRAVFDDLVDNGVRSTAYSPMICTCVLEHLVLAIRECAVPYGTFSTPAFTTYLRCRQYIEDHWQRIRTLDEVAARCAVSEAYLCRLFQRFDHRSPYQFLTRMKMGQAIQLLQVRGAKIGEVSEAMGYPDPFHFSRVFKKVYGVSPRQFMKLGRQR